MRDGGQSPTDLERPVVQSRRKSKPVVNQLSLPRLVSPPHGAQLRRRNMALVHNQQPVVFGEVVHQRLWRVPRPASGEMARVILDTLGEVAANRTSSFTLHTGSRKYARFVFKRKNAELARRIRRNAAA